MFICIAIELFCADDFILTDPGFPGYLKILNSLNAYAGKNIGFRGIVGGMGCYLYLLHDFILGSVMRVMLLYN